MYNSIDLKDVWINQVYGQLIDLRYISHVSLQLNAHTYTFLGKFVIKLQRAVPVNLVHANTELVHLIYMRVG